MFSYNVEFNVKLGYVSVRVKFNAALRIACNWYSVDRTRAGNYVN